MVRVARDGDVVVVTLDRPERRNAVDHATLLGLLDAERQAVDARVLVLTGAPPAFSAGADLTGVEEGRFAETLSMVLRGFTDLPIITMAAVDGPALGAGTQLAVACDLRVATPGSRVAYRRPTRSRRRPLDHRAVARELSWPVEERCCSPPRPTTPRRCTRRRDPSTGDLQDALAWAREIAALPRCHRRTQAGTGAVGTGTATRRRRRRRSPRRWRGTNAIEGRQAFLEKPARFEGR